jgi:methyltransferase family protein
MFLVQSQPTIPDGWGYHIRPIHYYEPIPDFRAVKHEQVNRRRNPVGIEFRWEEQLKLLHQLTFCYGEELRHLSRDQFNFDNGYFGGIDAAVYYSLIRHLAPKRIIEIGSGHSTRIALLALKRNQVEEKQGRLTCVEPNPERLQDQKLEIELLQMKVEDIPLEYFSCLEPNDILFIDSTHTVKFGSDVCYEFLEILPSLTPGVWVHVHDIFLPNDYPAEWILQRRMALNEQYLFEAFLSFSNAYSVELANHWLSLDYSDAVTALYQEASTKPELASSFWIRRN